MRGFTADAWLAAPPEQVLRALTEPEAIERWSPVGFEVDELDGGRLTGGGSARVRGLLAAAALEFDVDVQQADADGLALVAHGPVSMQVDYRLTPLDCGTQVRAFVGVSGSGLRGRVLARAAETLLAAGALSLALERIGRELRLIAA